MRLILTKEAFEDLQYWVKYNNKKAQKILDLIEHIQRAPFEGIGKPEPLKHLMNSCWSRRIDQEHRIVYKINNDILEILSCRYHYKIK